MRGKINNAVAGIASGDISASGYTVTIRRRGAIIGVTTSGPSGVRVPLSRAGKLRIGDTVAYQTGSQESVVATIASDYVILTWDGGGTRTFTAPGELTPTNDLPIIFGQEVGGVPVDNPITPASGVFECWIEGDGEKYGVRAQKTSATTFFESEIAPLVSRPAQIGEILEIDPSSAKAVSIRVGGVEVSSVGIDGAEHAPDGSITTAEIADKAITTAKIDDAAVDTGQIADGAVTPTQLDRTYIESDTDFYQTVKDNAGSAQTQRSVLKFAGSNIDVADSGGETVVTVSAGGGFIAPVVAHGGSSTVALVVDTETSRAATSGIVPASSGSVFIVTYSGVYSINPHNAGDAAQAIVRLYAGATKIAEGLIETFADTVGVNPAGIQQTITLIAMVTGLSASTVFAAKDLGHNEGTTGADINYAGAEGASTLTVLELKA